MLNPEVVNFYIECGKENKAIFISNIISSIFKIFLEILLSVVVISLLLHSLREEKYKKFTKIFIIFIIGFIIVLIFDAIQMFTQLKVDENYTYETSGQLPLSSF